MLEGAVEGHAGAAERAVAGDVAGILDQQEVRGWAECFLGRAGQEEGTASAKALRLNFIQCVERPGRGPLCLQGMSKGDRGRE